MYLMLETLACFRGFDARLVEGLASCLPSVCHGKEYNLDQFCKECGAIGYILVK